MWILTAEEMREADRITIEKFDIPGLILMEHAAIAVMEIIRKEFPEYKGYKFAVICGKGNNGGDGLAVARHLLQEGINTEIILIGKKEQLKGDALANLKMLKAYNKEIVEINEESQLPRLDQAIQNCFILIDALFGTGLDKPLKGFYSEVVKKINESGKIILSIDLPSGLSSDTGEIIGPSVQASLTVALATAKWCHIFPPAEEKCGKLFIKDIGIPSLAMAMINPKLKLLQVDDAAFVLNPRKKDTHKKNYGDILIVAGSAGKLGAAWMTAYSAMKSGAGLVTLAVPASLHNTVMAKVKEVMTMALPCTKEDTFSSDAINEIMKVGKEKDLIAIGPGITTHLEVEKLVHQLVGEYDKTMVIDADGLNCIAKDLNCLKKRKAPTILTPHPGEMARLVNLSTKEVLKERVKIARDFANKYSAIIILKGYKTIIADPEGNVYVNPTGNPGMATGGSGDVLTGMIAGFVAQNPKNIINAACSAVYLHGLAGDLAKKKVGEIPLIATDIIKFIPQAIKKVLKDTRMPGLKEE